MNLKLKRFSRTLKVGIGRERIHLLPTVRNNNWLPHYPFYHISVIWLNRSVEIWWLNYAT